ncbi:MAG: hypothetical protein NTAFB09_12830 [Nitrosospira sp.]
MEIKVLLRRGAGIREMARELGCSRNTVRRYVREAAAVRYGPRLARLTKLDPYKDYLQERIHAARPHWIPAVVLLREIRERGYPGGITGLKDFLSPYRHAEPEPVGSIRDGAWQTDAGRLHAHSPWPRSLIGICRHIGLQPGQLGLLYQQ